MCSLWVETTYVPESDLKVSSDAPKALKSIKPIFKSNIWTLKWKKTELLTSFLSRTCAVMIELHI